MLRLHCLVAFCLLCLLTLPLFSQIPNAAKLDSLFNLLSEKGKAMGSVAISQNGKLVYTKTIGFSHRDKGKPTVPNANTKYRIGSISKMFTAVMIYQLIEEKKLSLSTPLSKFFPKIPNAKKITIAQMLGHQSGIYSFTNEPDYLEWNQYPITQKELVKLIAKAEPAFEPGTKTEYSNSNYVLLGYIIEKLAKMPYKKALNDRITAKLRLKNTYYGGKIEVVKNEARSFRYAPEGWIQDTETDMSIPHGAGALVSTPSDLAKFIEALFAHKLITENSLKEMTKTTGGMGHGIFEFPFGMKKALGHNGKIDSFESILGYFPDDKIAIAYCSNGQAYPLNEVLIGALSIFFNLPYKIPEFKTLSLTPDDLKPYTGVYASSQIPLKITVTQNGATLMAQATGQPQFPLQATEPHVFKFDAAGVVMEFNPAANQMTLKQGGGEYLFTKE